LHFNVIKAQLISIIEALKNRDASPIKFTSTFPNVQLFNYTKRTKIMQWSEDERAFSEF
jgi:hypothetical protein